ncbi:unnamed protein product [Mytilus edulis]|uniref:Hexosyltransferase n=1 Tax=Mytilus edulis TaxID=6550 RepID=A0A8S3UMU9_MYTED|nr:unnamed protein product [Mytilus edulis]
MIEHIKEYKVLINVQEMRSSISILDWRLPNFRDARESRKCMKSYKIHCGIVYIAVEENISLSEMSRDEDKPIDLHIRKTTDILNIQKEMQINLKPITEKNKLDDEKVKQKQLVKENENKKQTQVNKVPGGIALKKSYDREFKYPLDINLKQLVQKLESSDKSSVQPINEHNYHFLYTPTNSCLFEQDNSTLSKIVILVKSSVKNFERRNVIRSTWGKYLEKICV